MLVGLVAFTESCYRCGDGATIDHVHRPSWRCSCDRGLRPIELDESLTVAHEHQIGNADVYANAQLRAMPRHTVRLT